MTIIMRRKTRSVMVGDVQIGDGAPVSIQTMTKQDPFDPAANIAEIRAAADLGCDIVRCALPTIKAAEPFAEIVRQSPLPVVADIHFDWRIAVAAIQAGAAKIRINPGNMENWEGIRKVLDAADAGGIPIRIGVNSGSVKHKNPDDPRPMPVALAEEALGYAARFEEMGFSDIVISVKASDAAGTILANRTVAEQSDFPLHIGVTAAGPREESLLKSAVGLGALITDGIGDTIRISFTGSPVSEVIAARDILRAAGIQNDAPSLMSCPTCGRCKVNLLPLVNEVKQRLHGITTPLRVAVMGCEVNGPGEAKEADVGIASSGGSFTLFAHGKVVRKVAREEAVDALMSEIESLTGETASVRSTCPVNRKILLLGATGSIGESTLAVVRENPESFSIVGMTANNNAGKIVSAIADFPVKTVAVGNPDSAEEVKAGTDAVEVLAGESGIIEAVLSSDADICVSAIVGSAGLRPTLAAIDRGMDIALANKETLVAAGEIVMRRVRENGCNLIPVDSEHSALYQCLAGRNPEEVKQIIITASGGPFFGYSRQQLGNVTLEEALTHPTWKMGAKITIDSATLANKALEVIEAHWLFDMPYDKISVLVHPQSLVHGMVQFVDGTMLALAGEPDMRVPIQYALSWPDRLGSATPAPSLSNLSEMSFFEPDTDAFPMLKLGYLAGRSGGVVPAIYSAANEEAVQLFLSDSIRFLDIPDIVAAAIDDAASFSPTPDLEEILEAENEARDFVKRRYN